MTHPSFVGDRDPHPFQPRLHHLRGAFPDQGLPPRLLLVARQLEAVAVLTLHLRGPRKGRNEESRQWKTLRQLNKV